MFNGKIKAVTFSYDDGITQDIRLIELLNKYGLKCTFNLNSELLSHKGILIRDNQRISHYKIHPSDVLSVYEGHEVAAHTLTHPNLTHLDDAEVIRQVENDRLNLSGTEVRKRLIEDSNWKELVPDATADIINEINGLERLKNLSIKEISDL